MLRKLLDLIRSGELTSQAEIAERMEISVGTLSLMITQLVHLGYLEVLDGSCNAGGACGHCDVRTGCFPQPKMWQLTEKGRQEIKA
jgi:hypothetical protein